MVDHPFNVLSICAGVGMLDLGLELAVQGARTVCYLEREAACVETLAARFQEGTLPEAPVFSDVTSFDGKPWRGVVDCLAGGIPCQPFSVAGDQKGNDDERAIAPAVLRLVSECLPPLVFIENVAPWVSRGYARGFLEGLHDLGYGVAAPLFLTAEAFGAPHRRERVFLLAYRDGHGREEFRFGSLLDGHRQACGDDSDGRDEGLPIFPPGPGGDWSAIPRDLWPAKPPLRGVAHGSSNRLDELRAAGNGCLPVVVGFAFKTLLESVPCFSEQLTTSESPSLG